MMLRHWTFGRKIGSAFALVALALIVVGVVGYRSARVLIANDEDVARTHEVRRAIADLLTQLVNAETGQRGFIITGREPFLEPYTSGLAMAGTLQTQLRAMLADDPEQQRRFDALRPKIQARLERLQGAIDKRRAGLDIAQATATADEGKRQMDEIRVDLAEIDMTQKRLLDQRAAIAVETSEMTTAVILYGSIAALALTLLVAWLLSSSLAKQVGTAVRHIQSSSTELQAAANQQASSTTEQSAAMSEIATTISELLATSRQIAESSQRVAQIATQTAAGARSGEITVAKGNEAIAAVRKQVEQIVEHMLELGKKSQQVGVVLEIVAELAEQTNILAINATIEAAGAGESGRRFGVVADEIRKLADRVAASTKEIRLMVEDVRGAVNTTVMSTEAGAKAVDTGAAQVSEMAVAFRQIAGLVGTTNDAAREIELSTKQQTTAVEQVNIAITNVAQATRETEASATQTLQTSVQLALLSTDLLKLVQSAA